MTKSERTRQHIIATTAPLFNSKGYAGTSLADLSEATGLTKGSLYGNFRDKEDVAREAFKYAVKQVKDKVKENLQGVSSYKGQLLALLDFHFRYVNDPPVKGGCPLLNTAIEADDYRPSMRQVVSVELMNTVKFTERLIRNGIRQGEFKKDTKAKELAYLFFCVMEGAVMFSRVERSSEPMEIIVRHCKNILDQISVK